MKYDPIKKVFGDAVRSTPVLRILFYKLLGLMFLREWHVKRALRRLLGETKEPFSIYDAGSGFGQYAYYMATHFPAAQIYGIDLKDEQVADCAQFFRTIGLHQCTFAVEDLTQIRHENRFDFILSVDVMEHIAEDVLVFRNFYRSLRKNGVLFINTPSNLGGSDAHSPDDASFIEEHARNGYGNDEIRQKLESVGFVVESIRYTYGPWGDRYWRFAIKYPMLLVNVSKALLILLPFYYLVVLPFTLPMMWLDYIADNKAGTGLNVVARRKN
jgi:SAM-dependent methyltransferase